MDQFRCIYCDNYGPAGNEHVLSRLLFDPGPNTFTMKEVCNQCNNSFGRELEQDMRRDSLEGLFSSMFGIKASSEIVVYNRRLQIRTESTLHPVLEKALPSLDLPTGKNSVVGRFETQIILERPSGNRHIFPIARLDPYAKRKIRSMPGDSVGYLVLESADAQISTSAIIQDLNLSIPDDRQYIAHPVQIDFDFQNRIDRLHCRAIAKNAFNIFARTLLVKGLAHEIYQGFREIKEFIRAGNGPLPVRCIEAELVSTAFGSYSDGYPLHAVCWRIEDGQVKANLQFFNLLLYEVTLGPAFEFTPKEPDKIGYGFLIDVKKREAPDLLEVMQGAVPNE